MKTNSSRPLCILCWIASVSLLAAMCLAATTARGAESLPEGLKVVSIEARPTSIELQHRFDYRQLLLSGKLENGQFVDLTRVAKLESSSEAVTVSETRLVGAKADGGGALNFSFDGKTISVPVKVTGVKEPYNVSFIRDVQPAFSRMGCSAGTCHGSKDGQNGFKLSLRSYDAVHDYRAFTDDLGARRFNRAAPDQSLMLLKATGSIAHVGGQLTKVGDPYYEMLRLWIADGVKYDGAASPRVTKIAVHPQNPIVPRAGLKQQITVQATYSDGSVRDVTREAFIESGNIEIIEAEEGGVLKMLRRGESPVLVRFEGAYAATTLTVMGDREGFVWKKPETFNYVDEHVYNKLERVKVLPSGLCTDEEFVRRVYLDLTGLPPTSKQVREFLADKRERKVKRDALVDSLVGSREFVEHWTNKWADLLQVNRKFLGEEGAVALRNWIKDKVATNTPYDQLARDVISASGSTLQNPPASYFKILRNPADLMENTTHLFLAVRFNCNKCHDHPFERWTQDQYYDLASYFAQVGRKEDPAFKGKKIGGTAVEGAKPLVEVIFDTGSGEVKHDRTGENVSPKFPYQHDDVLAEGTRREQLAHWITSPQNQYFAKSYVNRLWGYLFGVGIIEPIDDIRAGNPPTNPELLDALTKDFVDNGFDVQHMFRTICKSRTYQHSFRVNEWNADDEINYSHALLRRLPAEVLYDAIHVATGSQQKIPGVPPGFRAAQLPDVGIKLPFLDDFGRPVRESVCECERSDSMVLGPIMKLINGPTVANAVMDPGSELTKLVQEQKDDEKLIEEVYMRFFGQAPTKSQLEIGLRALQVAGEGHEENVKALAEYERTLAAKQTAWEESLGKVVEWTVLDPVEMKSNVGATFTKNPDKSVFVSGKNGKDVYSVVAHSDLVGITGVKLEALNDGKLPAGGPGRAKNGNFVINEFTVAAAPKADPSKSTKIVLANASADFSQQGWPVAAAIDGNIGSGWAVSPQFNKPHTAIFETKQNAGPEGGVILTFSFNQQFQDSTHSLGKFRLSVTNSPRPLRLDRLPADLAKLLAIPADKRNDQQKADLRNRYLATDAEYTRLQQAVAQTENELKNRRLVGVQDLAWALINNPAFLFNR